MNFGHWLAGIADGEGSFCVRRSARKDGYVEWQPSFTIGLRADDEDILRQCREFAGAGRLKYYSERTSSRGIRSRPRIDWECRTHGDCMKIVRLFEQYPLRAKKRKDFIVWAEIVRYLLATRGSRDGGRRDVSVVEAMVLRLREGRKWDENRKDESGGTSGRVIQP